MCGASDIVIASDDCFFSLPEIDRGAMGGRVTFTKNDTADKSALGILNWRANHKHKKCIALAE